jgi:outer membrane lipoprotein-sorting protein
MNDRTHEYELDGFLDELIDDPDTPAPMNSHLDADTIACARRVVAAELSAMPDPAQEMAAAARVWERVLARANDTSTRAPRAGIFAPWFSPWRSWRRAGAALSAIIVAVALGVVVWSHQAPAVSAQEIVDKALASVNSPAAGGVSSFALVEMERTAPGNTRLNAYAGLKDGELLMSETHRWYQAPNQWRSEHRQWVVAPDGKETNPASSIQVGDGTDLWSYESAGNAVVVNTLDPSQSGKYGLAPFDQDIADLQELFAQASNCFDPKLTGNATVAGRATYVVDLGSTRCPSASAPEMNGRLVIWVDQETFFVLKQEQHRPENDQIVLTREVTQVQYNQAIDPARFAFTPPPGASITDNRSKPAPTASQFEQQLEQIAQVVDFPVLAPTTLPPGLAPRQPKIDQVMGIVVELSYYPLSEPDKDSLASLSKGLMIREQRATNSLVANWTDQANPTTIGNNQGWLRRGVRNADGTGSDSAALVLRDGVLVSVSSFTIAPEELVQVAAGLVPVPGGHVPLANPVPPTLAELRAHATLPIFVPRSIPEGLVAEPPTSGEQPGENITIKYHAADGTPALTVVNGTPDGNRGLDQMTSTPVTLSNGVAAKFADLPANAGGSILWFTLEGRLITLSSPTLTRDQILQIGASLSKTVELGRIEPVPARPTATPLAPLAFSVLRPAWLPEPATAREQRDGESVILGFDPRPNAGPHDVLTLREIPMALVLPGGNPDPQASQEQIGGQIVTIIRRGQACITFEWNAGDVHLALTNAYDPPGQPRYTCDVMRKIVASIK